MAKTTIIRTYSGRAETALTSQALLQLFDDLWGADNRHLPVWPAVMGGVRGSWIDESRAHHQAESIDELIGAHERFETAHISFSSGLAASPKITLEYAPNPAMVYAKIEARDAETADALRERIAATFPLEATYVFISYETSEVGLALFVQRLLEARVAPGVSVFVAKRDITPGTNPLKVMLEEQLPHAQALIALCSRRSKESPWLWWEASAVWAKQGLVVPLFVDISPSEFDGPLTLVCQGRRFGDAAELASALRTVLAKVSPGRECPDLSDVEIEELGALQSASDSSGLEITVVPAETGQVDTPENRQSMFRLARLVGANIEAGRDPLPILKGSLRQAGSAPAESTASEGPTVREYFERWVADKVPPEVRRAQALDYRRHIRGYVLPKVGNVEIESLTAGFGPS